MVKQVHAVFFAPTGNTRKSVEAMAGALAENFEVHDVTLNAPAEEKIFGRDDVVIFGAPVYSGRIPAVARERLTKFRGEGTRCLAVVTFGNRDFDDALLELADLSKGQGFVVTGGAAVVGRHTYGSIQVDRPDAADLAADRDFALKAAAQAEIKTAIPGNRPYKSGGLGGKFRPKTAENCIDCGLCVKFCPVQAVGADCRTIDDRCLACFRCIRICPVHAKNMDTEEYRTFAQMFSEKLKERRENQYFL